MINDSNSKSFSFSVLMANYNNANYIEEAIMSVISQTYPKWELIIVDDYSNDNSIEVVNKFLKDKRIKLIQHKKNLGYGGALKTAAKNAFNEILGILDPDDKLHEKALEIMVESYKHNPECGFIYSTMWACDSELKNCKVTKWIGPIVPEKTNIFQSKISHFKTFLKDVYERTFGYDPNQKRTVDNDIIYKLEEVTNFKFINVPLYYYRQHESGISQGKNKFQARIYLYRAKCKAYQRRINTDLPNLTLKYLYVEYFKITFHSLIDFTKNLFKLLRISELYEKLIAKFLTVLKKIRKFHF